jgi:hypothetical protein
MSDLETVNLLFLVVQVAVVLVVVGQFARIGGLFFERERIELGGMIASVVGIFVFLGVCIYWFGFVATPEALVASINNTTCHNQTCQWVNNSTTSILICSR